MFWNLSGFKLGLCREKPASGIWYKKLPVGFVALYTGQEPRISLYPHSNCVRPRPSVLGTHFLCCCLSSSPQTQTHHLFGIRRSSSLSMHLAFLLPTQICGDLYLCSLGLVGDANEPLQILTRRFLCFLSHYVCLSLSCSVFLIGGLFCLGNSVWLFLIWNLTIQ